jgi:hypothetical protein
MFPFRDDELLNDELKDIIANILNISSAFSLLASATFDPTTSI